MMSAFPKPTEMLTKAEVAQRLQVSIKTIERWMASGDLPVHRFGKSVRISTADFRAFLDKRRKWSVIHT
ncbi:MAG: DNA-binding protein [Hyphomicrobiales bacterium]|jgi:excisionase family DNA binding protein|nr:MAG: DNA-binding protein [Hyphomicrobiales bacterium]